jgi:hypothetical protein
MRNLLIVRAGPSSTHAQWLQHDSNRNWDIGLSCFGGSPPPREDLYRFITYLEGPKWPAVKQTVMKFRSIIAEYDYIWIPDDDLVMEAGSISHFFWVCAEAGLGLAQPALTSDSFFTHPLTVCDSRYVLRYTNFVEIMAPCFRRDVFSRCLPTFDLNITGWGLDFIWPTLLDQNSLVGIVDAFAMRHPRPVGGPNYYHLDGCSPQRDMDIILHQLGIRRKRPKLLGGVSAEKWLSRHASNNIRNLC